MLNLVLFGPPGSGKGTQAERIVTKYKLVHLSTGDMLRAEIAGQTSLGLEAKALMDKGELVPDTVVIGMIENKLDNNKTANGFVFDGFPRTVAQAEALDSLLAKRQAPIKAVLSLYVSEGELTKRILNRGKTSGRADDQNESIVKNRVAEYRTKTEPLSKYYEHQGKLKQIIGEGTIEEISALLFGEIDKVKSISTASEK
jgi:adenylate kinase